VAWLAAGGCAALPEVKANECGNGVIEGTEDCETLAPIDGFTCRAPGLPGECRFDCSRTGRSGAPNACPTGWGCDPMGVCHEPLGSYQPPAEFRVGGATTLLASDFDGDHRQDVISLGPPDDEGATRMRVNYFDASGALAESRLFPKRVAAPSVADLSGDGPSDLLFTYHNEMSLLLGQGDRGWVPETYSGYHVPDAPVRMIAIYGELITGGTATVALSSLDGKPGFYNPDPQTGVLQFNGPLPGPLEELVGSPAVGNLIEDPLTSPCSEVVLAVRGATTFTVADVCQRSPETQQVSLRQTVQQWTVGLVPPVKIDQPLQIADVDGDGHLDVLVGGEGKVFVSRGDGGKLAPGVPLAPVTVEVPPAGFGDPERVPRDVPMPLAAGDVSGDGVVDYVVSDMILVSRKLPTTGAIVYTARGNIGAPWTMARIADLNGNGKPDVVAASQDSQDVSFFNGNGTAISPVAYSVPTNGKVKLMAVGDVDGDLTNDLLIIEAAVSSKERDALLIAYGTPSGPPQAPVLIGRFNQPEDLQVVGGNGMSGIIVASSEAVPGHRNGLLTTLEGSPDRLPLAPHTLTDLSSNNVIEEAALGLVAGAFRKPGQVDALAMGWSPVSELVGFWVVPAPGTADNAATRFDATLDGRLRPLRLDRNQNRAFINVASTAADLDRDGRAEGLWATPADDGAHCGLVVVSPAPAGAKLARLDTLVLDDPCLAAQVSAADVDGDGFLDVLLLVGDPGSKSRKLLVLWNDGKGGLSRGSMSVVSGDMPQAFTTIPATAGKRIALAYVNDRTAVLLRPAGGPPSRGFAAPEALASLSAGTGIVAADVNGDGVIDLVVAAGGNLQVMRADLDP
jgi:hypothetical protein